VYEREKAGGALSEREKVFSGRLSVFSPRVRAVNKSGGTPGTVKSWTPMTRIFI
jgi:hypothetical protein